MGQFFLCDNVGSTCDSQADKGNSFLKRQLSRSSWGVIRCWLLYIRCWFLYNIYIYIVAFKASPSSQHQHCTDEAQKAKTVLSAVSYIYIYIYTHTGSPPGSSAS